MYIEVFVYASRMFRHRHGMWFWYVHVHVHVSLAKALPRRREGSLSSGAYLNIPLPLERYRLIYMHVPCNYDCPVGTVRNVMHTYIDVYTQRF